MKKLYAFFIVLLSLFLFKPSVSAQVDWVGNTFPNFHQIVTSGNTFFVMFQAYKAGATGSNAGLNCEVRVTPVAEGDWPRGNAPTTYVTFPAMYTGSVGNNDEFFATVGPFTDNGRYSFECACSDDGGSTFTSSWDYVGNTGDLQYFTIGTGGIYRSMVILDDGTGDTYYDMLKFQPGNDPLQNVYTGPSTPGIFLPSESFFIRGGEMNVFKNGSGNVTGGALFWSIDGGASGSIPLPFSDDCPNGYPNTFAGGGSCFNYGGTSGTDQRWRETTAAVDLIQEVGGVAGTYDLRLYTEVYTDQGTVRDPQVGTYNTQFVVSSQAFSVDWVSFEGELVDDYVRLLWATGREEDSDKFIVERSIDGVVFEMIGEVKAGGYTTEESAYRFVDHTFSGASPSYYYRIREVGIDGNSSFSDVIEIQIPTLEDQYSFTPFPNPASTELYLAVRGNLPRGTYISIINMYGQEVYRTQIESSSLPQALGIDVGSWRRGLYMAKLSINGFVLSKKILLE